MLFFSTADREYIVKTVTSNELKFLERELKSYYDYMVVNGATSLLPRFVGLYFLKLPDKVRTESNRTMRDGPMGAPVRFH